MSLETIILILSPVSIFTFFFLELGEFNLKHLINKRLGTALSMELLSKSLGFLLSSTFLLTFVNFVAPFELVSISRLDMPKTMNFLLSLLVIDFFHYLSHRLHHQVPLLWRFHRLHHSDRSLDALTSFIHHPLEAISIFVLHISLYVIFDIPVIAILGYSFLMIVHFPFSHTTFRLPKRLETFLGYFLITPRFHRVHHSLDINEGNSAFGNIFPFWDRLFGTFIPQSDSAIKKMVFGININESPKDHHVASYLMNPFLK